MCTRSKISSIPSRLAVLGWYCSFIYPLPQRLCVEMEVIPLGGGISVWWKMKRSSYFIWPPSQCQTTATCLASQAQWPFPHINERWRGSIGWQEDRSPRVERGDVPSRKRKTNSNGQCFRLAGSTTPTAMLVSSLLCVCGASAASPGNNMWIWQKHRGLLSTALLLILN